MPWPRTVASQPSLWLWPSTSQNGSRRPVDPQAQARRALLLDGDVGAGGRRGGWRRGGVEHEPVDVEPAVAARGRADPVVARAEGQRAAAGDDVEGLALQRLADGAVDPHAHRLAVDGDEVVAARRRQRPGEVDGLDHAGKPELGDGDRLEEGQPGEVVELLDLADARRSWP